jgi:ferrous iron transport protein B
MILGFGCNVPAVMAARSIEDRKTRLITTLIVPFMPCSARLPIFVLIAGVFFTGMESIAIMAMYLFGLTTALISALLLRRLVLKGEAEYIMELPPFRRPKATDIWNLTWARTKHFLVKAGTVILAMSVVIWYLTNYPSENVSQSYAGMLGKLITPLFSPLGWGWEISVAIIMGFVAKEIVIETFGILLGDAANITSLMTLPQAFAFMVFVSLYVPCMATIATIKAETGGWKYALFSVGYSTAVAYVIALLAFKILEVVL